MSQVTETSLSNRQHAGKTAVPRYSSPVITCRQRLLKPFKIRDTDFVRFLSTCPAHCNLFLTSLSVKLLCTPVSSLNYTILSQCISKSFLYCDRNKVLFYSKFLACLPSGSLLLLFFVPSCFRTLVAYVVAVPSVPRFPFRTGMPV